MKLSASFLPLFALSAVVCSCDKEAAKTDTPKAGVSKVEAVGDATFARKTFTSLARGDSAVADSIDWPTLRSLGKNVGMEYVALKSEEERKALRDGFITQFSSAFIANGGKVEDFTGWKTVEHDATHTVVSALAPGKNLRITVNQRDGKDRVSALELLTP